MRLVFTAAGLARTTFTISPLHHTLFAALCLRNPGYAATGSFWRDLAQRVPPRAAAFLERVDAGTTTDTGFVWMRAPLMESTRPTLGDELEALANLGGVEQPAEPYGFAYPGQLGDAGLSDSARPGRCDAAYLRGNVSGLREVADAVRAFYTSCIAPEWAGIRRQLETHLASRAEVVCLHGLGHALSKLSPRLRWGDSTLHIDTSGVHAPEVVLGARGLALSPLLSASQRFVAVAFSPDARRPVLAYPVADERSEPMARGTASVDALARVVGHARARVLRSIGAGRATGELAQSLAVSASTVSEHMTALRLAGLVVTYREGRAVRHVLTALGHRLLESSV
ncbi:ArsR/SmtB family transcription factor [Streptosporangium canum]|uniref:ArsR/SmtB family transcription factor n=1 Tax=Streptosporangium canum TaxID=324952 RepID=UPI0033A76E61